MIILQAINNMTAFNITDEIIVKVKKTKTLKMYYDTENKEILFEKDGIYFSLKRNEIFPALRGIISAIQRFYRRKEVK